MVTVRILMLASAATLAGCAATMGSGAPRADAIAMLRGVDGGDRGRVTVTNVGGGMRLAVDATGLAPDAHGFHVHAVGRCDAPDFTSAGPHWNPDAKLHGRDNPAGAHRGDLPNLIVGSNGRGQVSFNVPATAAALLEGPGKSIIIHADVDDYRTDPGGNSGGRVVCGVFAAD